MTLASHVTLDPYMRGQLGVKKGAKIKNPDEKTLGVRNYGYLCSLRHRF